MNDICFVERHRYVAVSMCGSVTIQT
jgi:hypothetical protein